MFRRIKYSFVILIAIIIVSYGFIKVSNELPLFIKDRSPVKVTYSKSPFDITIDIGDYIIYLNSKALSNIKNAITSKI